jgi:hypothetical protein
VYTAANVKSGADPPVANVIQGFLFEVQPYDVIVYAIVGVTFVAAGLLAA